jgi:hypothetical protein
MVKGLLLNKSYRQLDKLSLGNGSLKNQIEKKKSGSPLHIEPTAPGLLLSVAFAACINRNFKIK